MELVVWSVHGITVPIDDLPKTIENSAQLDPNAPAPFIFGLSAELLGRRPVEWEQRLNREVADCQEKARISQKAFVPVLVGYQQPLETRAIGQVGKGIHSRVSAIDRRHESDLLSALIATDCDQLARIQLRLMVLGYLFHLVIDKAKNLDNNVFGGHNESSFRDRVCSSLWRTTFLTASIS